MVQTVTVEILNDKVLPLLRDLELLQLIRLRKLPIQPTQEVPAAKPVYDFSDLTGKLQWQGDALAAQQVLRDEWK